MGASKDQVLTWTGSTWAPSSMTEGLFKVNNNSIVYNSPSDFGKDFLVNTNQVNRSSGNEYKMMFIPSKEGAFRVGYISNLNWNIGNVGNRSFAVGSNTKAIGTSSAAMGSETIAFGDFSTAMGDGTEASGLSSTAMGSSTVASGHYSTAMGINAEAVGLVSTAMGWNTKASGDYSTAMGSRSQALASNSTVIGDNITLNSNARGSMYLADASRDHESDKDTRGGINRFYARFDGGYWFATSGTTDVGVYMNSGGNSWSSISDSTKKENYLQADGKSFLDKIGQMKLGSWNYKGQDKSQYRHYGPMAQEFHAYFGNDGIGVIGNDTTISTADIDGVMMIAIQALIKENEELKQKNELLEQQQEVLATEVSTLKNAQQNTEVLLLEIQAGLNAQNKGDDVNYEDLEALHK